MTPVQTQYLKIIKEHNAAHFAGWFKPSEIMAFCQVESNFRPNAFRREPSGVRSYGPMQVLNTTATAYGVHQPETMYNPEVGILIGMRVAYDNWQFLVDNIGPDPSYEDWSAAYNEGPTAVVNGRTDDAYTNAWDKAQEFWAAQGIDL